MKPATKPHIRLIPAGNGRVEVEVAPPRETLVDAARRRHGKPFATEAGNTHKPRETPLLTEWLASRVKGST